MTNAELVAQAERVLIPTYRRFPVAFVRGRGATLWDADGKAYTDFLSGIAVCVLGHCHPRVVAAITKQAETLLHVSNFYHTLPQTEVATFLAEHSFGGQAFFCNSGAEANEAALKLARKYGRDHHGPERFEVIAMVNSFHGRTLGTVAATGQTKVQHGFEPLLPGFRHVPYGDLAAVEQAMNEHTCAVLVEPIQGEGGVVVPPEGYLEGLRHLCDQRDVLLIFDEIQTGIGHTGYLFGYQHSGVVPDIMTLAKGLAGGLPIGVMLAKPHVAASLGPGTHGSTFGGNPVACSAALAVLQTITEEDLLAHVRQVGAYFMAGLRRLQAKYPFIVDVRGRGLMLAAELDRPCAHVVSKCLERGYLINCTVDRVLRFLPPLIITEQEVDGLLATLDAVLAEE
ncbi:MAG: acetylornithine aminotransferase [Candidatus Tectimicrobiota bacterium]|nr:MAG: acetylornithine aminotransferase [Candidatus Tectomicrobia bacterium]